MMHCMIQFCLQEEIGVAAVIARNKNGETVKVDIVNGDYQIIYTAPEMLLRDKNCTEQMIYTTPEMLLRDKNCTEQMIYTAPEMLLRDKNWTEFSVAHHLLQRLVALDIDEAYCVKKW